MASETTPLTSNIPAGPSYVFHGSRRRQVRQFQCCICATFLAISVLVIVMVVSMSIHGDDERDIDINTTEKQSEINNTLDINPFNILLVTNWPLKDEPIQRWILPNLTEMETVSAIEAGKKALAEKDIMEEHMSSSTLNSPTYRHQRVTTSTPEARIITKRGFVENYATLDIIKKYPRTNPGKRWSIGKGPAIKMQNERPAVKCYPNSKYRSSNGTCNNQKHPNFGNAMIPFRRALFADYADGISKPRAGHKGATLASAREISITVHRPSYQSDPHFTVMLAVWGQFLDHDITATAANQGSNGQSIECCDNSTPKHPECFPVPLGPGDPYYDMYNMTCMNFVRSAAAPTGHFGQREQLNQATAFIDGSVVYGSNDERVTSLRTNKLGLLRMFVSPDNRTLLPVSADLADGCNKAEMNSEGKYCFDSGDVRANENLHLTSMHLIWARHHNYLASKLIEINPHWDDETLFQEARRILAAQMQHITYNEFLPMLLGEQFTTEAGISSNFESQKDTYDPNVNPSIANNFASAAFRFAHTLLPGLMRVTSDTNTSDAVALHEMLFNPYSLWNKKGLDRAINSAIDTPLAKSDQFFTSELTEKLFQSVTPNLGKMCGLDLVSLNIQRGRDHGIPAYTEWRKHCNLPVVDTWEKLQQVVDNGSYTRMKEIYVTPEDIDLYTGALSEPPMEGAIVGPLLSCLIGDQFIRLKQGDSHWYERPIGAQRFTTDQLKEIYGTTLAGIICRNSDNIENSQKYVMRCINNDDNTVINCNLLDTFNFTSWTDHLYNINKNKIIKLNTQQSNIIVIANRSANENNTILLV